MSEFGILVMTGCIFISMLVTVIICELVGRWMERRHDAEK